LKIILASNYSVNNEAYSVVGKIYLRQQVEDQKEHAI